MAAYLITEIEVTDDAWTKAYAAEVHELLARHGGRYLARSGNIDNLEGDYPPATLVAIVEFPSKDAIRAFAADPDYAKHTPGRRAGSNSRFRMIDDTDIFGAVPYLPAG